MLTRYLIQLTDRPGALSKRLLPLPLVPPTAQLPVELGIINIDRQTDKQFIIKLDMPCYTMMDQDIAPKAGTLAHNTLHL